MTEVVVWVISFLAVLLVGAYLYYIDGGGGSGGVA